MTPKQGSRLSSMSADSVVVCLDSSLYSDIHIHNDPSQCKFHCRRPAFACSLCRMSRSTEKRKSRCFGSVTGGCWNEAFAKEDNEKSGLLVICQLHGPWNFMGIWSAWKIQPLTPKYPFLATPAILLQTTLYPIQDSHTISLVLGLSDSSLCLPLDQDSSQSDKNYSPFLFTG